MSQDALGPNELLSILAASADTLSSPLEAVAAFSHACMLATGFRFLGFGEDHKSGPHPHTHADASELDFDESNIQKLWISESPSHHEFRYAHPQSSLEFIIKVSRLGTKTVIMGLAVGDDKTASFDIKTEDFTSAGFFPWSASDGQNVVAGFIGENRLKDLARLFKINILQKLIPGLGKAGYTEDQTTATEATQPQRYIIADPVLMPSQQPRPPAFPDYTGHDPLRATPPRRPYDPEPMPDFEDPYDLMRPQPLFPAPYNPLSIGHDDLNPPGIGNPFHPGSGGLGPTGLPRPGGQGGMLMDIRGRGRGGERPPGVPPGARWDPIGPGRGGRGGPPNPFGGYIDDDYI
jgi:hypothetical protein